MKEGPEDRSRFHEDYQEGEVIRAPGVTLTESDIIEFAFRYDPQAFHIDKTFAATSIYGGLIASGWQVVLTGFRMLVQAGFLGRGSMGSPAVDEVRFLKPVRPGDTIYARAEVVSKRESQSRPGLGLVDMTFRIENQSGECCCTWRGVQLVQKRDAAG